MSDVEDSESPPLVLKPKKEKKKTIDLETVENGVAEITLKKKKKKEPKGDGDGEKSEKRKKKKKEGSGDEADGAIPELDLSKKKKKSSQGKSRDGSTPVLELGEKKSKKKGGSKGKPKVVASDRIMNKLDEADMVLIPYGDLLERVFNKMTAHGIGQGVKETKRFTVPPPKMVRMGTKRTVFQNFGGICFESFKREPKHVMNFILNELGATGNLDVNNALIIKGKFKPSQMESILRTYIKEYIICKTCRGNSTYLDKVDRLMFIICHDCSSRSTVAQNKVGFLAVTGKRKKLREKEGTGPAPAAMKAK